MITRLGGVLSSGVVVSGLVLATARCGLLASPGDYAASGEAENPSNADASTVDTGASDVVVLPDGNVVPSSAGTLVVAAGQGDPVEGEDDAELTSDVWNGVLDAEGRVVEWRPSSHAPVVGAFDSAAIVSGQWFVTSRGAGYGGVDVTLQSALWGPGLSAGWRATQVPMPSGLDEPVRVFVGPHLVTVGGARYASIDGGTVTNFSREIHVADVDVERGTVGRFGDSVGSLVKERSRPAVVLSGTHLYVIGGRSSSGVTGAVEMASVTLDDGAVAEFASQPSLTVGGDEHEVYRPGAIVAGGSLFVVGGTTNYQFTPTDVVLSAKIDATTGALGEFVEVAKLPIPLRDFGLVAHAGKLYVIGGTTNIETDAGSTAVRVDDVFSAAIHADGSLDTWSDANAKLPQKRSYLVGVAY